MDEVLKILLIYGFLPSVIGVGAWIMRSTLQRINDLEKKIVEKLDEDSVRQLLDDKVDPIREDIHDLKAKIDKIYDLLLKK